MTLEDAYAILRRMKCAIKPGMNYGFTIVETLIVLAVSGAILLSAIFLVNGRQNQSEFNQAIHNAQSKISQVINDATDGYYPNSGNFSCTNGTILHGSNGQGTNKGCLFLGEAVQFGIKNTDPEQFETYTIIGAQQNVTGQEVSSYSQAQPEVPVLDGNVLAATSSSLDNGLTVYDMRYTDKSGATYPTGGVAFLSSLAAYSGGAGGTSILSSGAQQLYLIPLSNGGTQTVRLGQTTDAASGGPYEINEAVTGLATYADQFVPSSTSSTPLPTSVDICFKSGSTDQSGLITITSGYTNGSGQLAESLTIKENTTCA